MPRSPRNTPGGFIYHVLNRANGRLPIFSWDGDYLAFENILLEAFQHVPAMRLLDYCLMPNHWHLILWPVEDGELSSFLQWITLTHTQRWKAQYDQVGTGHLYQGRFKSFPVEEDDHFLTVCRYVERNALRARLVDHAEEWRWGSLWYRLQGTTAIAHRLSPWPVPWLNNWLEWVNTPLTILELEAVRNSVNRGNPFGRSSWTESTAKQLGLEGTLRQRGRPRKQVSEDESGER